MNHADGEPTPTSPTPMGILVSVRLLHTVDTIKGNIFVSWPSSYLIRCDLCVYVWQNLLKALKF